MHTTPFDGRRHTLRGHGPAPAGWARCLDTRCPARRDPFTGRFPSAAQWHYHPCTPAAIGEQRAQLLKGGASC